MPASVEKNVEWALDVTKGASGDLLEMYCGKWQFLNSSVSTFLTRGGDGKIFKKSPVNSAHS